MVAAMPSDHASARDAFLDCDRLRYHVPLRHQQQHAAGVIAVDATFILLTITPASPYSFRITGRFEPADFSRLKLR